MPSNMKLSNLARFKEDLNKFVKLDEVELALTRLDEVITSIHPKTCDPEFAEYLEEFKQCISEARYNLDSKIKQISMVSAAVDKKVSEMSQKYFAANYQMELLLTEESERRTRNKAFSEEARALLEHRLVLYSDWHYPGLEIGPGSGVWTKCLVSNDPLYLLDIRKSYLDETKALFPVEYQNRLRCYLIPENNEPEDLSGLPQKQFGFVVSINVFEYFSFDKIRHYLEEVWKLLRPGGVFLFTYNNGERPECAQLAENGTVSYIPKTMLVTFCETHGYEVIKTFDLDNTVCWIEIRKPGELKTVKAHQAMGEIKYKSS